MLLADTRKVEDMKDVDDRGSEEHPDVKVVVVLLVAVVVDDDGEVAVLVLAPAGILRVILGTFFDPGHWYRMVSSLLAH